MKAKTKRGRPTKTDDSKKARYLQVRVNETEKQGFDRAAEIAGIDLSAWVRERLRMIARKELDAAGEVAAFMAK